MLVAISVSNYFTQFHTRLAMYYLRPLLSDIMKLLYDLVKVSLLNTNCIGAVTLSNQIGTNTLHIETMTPSKEILIFIVD